MVGRRRHVWLMIAVLPLLGAAPPASPPVAADHAEKMTRGVELFAKHVRPLFLETCYKCHGGEKTRGGLDLGSRETLLKGGDNGVVVVVNQSVRSKLYRLAAHLDAPAMPPRAPRLKDEQLARLAAWIDLGAPYDKPLSDATAKVKKPMVVTDEDRQFWSFQPLGRFTPPKVKNESWARTPIDRFILAKLEEKGLAPNKPVDRRRLIRRATFDLIGLPPTPEEVEAFVNDPDPLAYDKLVERLLASPHYGETWGRHWLDVARYAESHGFEQDYDRPAAYPYRDFVIKALNQDLPYDKFVQWQLAGDELEPENPLALMATGFLGAGVHSTQITASQVEKERYDELDDIVRTTGTAMLGLTVGCARCHDHKYDPIPVRDYYRLMATFTKTVRSEMDIDLNPAETRAAHAKFDPIHAKLTEALALYEKDQLAEKFNRWLADVSVISCMLPSGTPVLALSGAVGSMRTSADSNARDAVVKWFGSSDPEWKILNRAVQEHLKLAPKPAIVKAMICSEGVPAIRLHTQGGDFLEQTYFLKRGDPNQKDGVASQGFLQVLMRTPDREKHWQTAPPPGSRTPYSRRALAAWITDLQAGAGHLLARVVVNRLWQHHFGRGIVATTSDFGMQGERPTHPELLDWLANELIANGWRLKPIHKLIMTSAVYTQGDEFDSRRGAIDPDNRLLWRRTPKRLSAEAIRDSMLAVSGTLDRTMYGPGTLDPNMKRRSIYFFVKRSQLVPAMILFDGPDSLQGVEQRVTTTVPPQALLLMNNGAVRKCAEAFATRVAGDPARPTSDAVRAGYATALGRKPSEEELAELAHFIDDQTSAYRADGKADARHLAITDFCQVLMGLNEFVYVD